MSKRYLYLPLVIMLLLSAATNAQQKVYITESLDECDSAHAKYYIIYTLDSGRYKKEKYSVEKNELLQIGYFTNPDSQYTGHFINYYKGYAVGRSFRSEGELINNKQTGTWKNYRDGSDKIWFTEQFKTGTIQELTSYYEDGKIKRKETHDTLNKVTGKCYDESGSEIAFTPFFTLPKCPYDMAKYLQKKLEYPNYASEHNISGRVIVQFIVDTSGNITDTKLLKHIAGGCDEKASKVVSSFPKWIPGMQDDKAVNIYFTLPISFNL